LAILPVKPVTSPTRAETCTFVRPSQLAWNGVDGRKRLRSAGAASAAAAGAGGALRPAASILVASMFTATLGTPWRSVRNSASPVSSLLPTFRVGTSTLKFERKVAALALSV
jgi:hypothetical protein